MDKQNVTVVYLVRHSLTESNKNKIYAGWGDEELAPEGIVQADQLGSHIKNFNISRIYSSPIKRALQTAQILNNYVKTEIILEHGFIEMRLGPWEGLSEEQVELNFPEEYRLWLTKPAELKLDGRETLETLQGRVLETLKKIVKRKKNQKLMVITHVAIIRCLILWFKGFDLNFYKTIDVPNLSIFKLRFEDGERNEISQIRI